jgi:outer membrane protein assembly factor BamB
MKTALWLITEIALVLAIVFFSRRNSRRSGIAALLSCIAILVLISGIAYKNRDLIETRIEQGNNSSIRSPFVPQDRELTAEAWASFRGGSRQNTVPESYAIDKIAWGTPHWRVAVEGTGHSSPCMTERHVFLTTAAASDGSLSLIEMAAESGDVTNRVTLPKRAFGHIHANNSHASPSPATDGGMVFVVWENGSKAILTAVRHGGNVAWSLELGTYVSRHGIASSPCVYRGLVICAIEGRNAPFLVAVDAAHGRIVWRTRLRTSGWSFGSPQVLTVCGTTQLLLATCNTVQSYDPLSGEQIWSCAWKPERSANCVVATEDHVFACSTSPEGQIICIRGDGKGDVTSTHVEWKRNPGAGYVVSPLVVSNGLLMLSDAGILTLVDRATGHTIVRHRLQGNFFSSPLGFTSPSEDGECVLACNDDGRVFLVNISENNIRQLVTHNLDGPVMASPILFAEHLLIRTDKSLYCWTPDE